jgi:Ni/Co efflux regulator RcnB
MTRIVRAAALAALALPLVGHAQNYNNNYNNNNNYNHNSNYNHNNNYNHNYNYNGKYNGSHRYYYNGGYYPQYRGTYYRYPPGYSYRTWSVGAVLPPVFLSSTYYFNDFAMIGLRPPPYGYRWVRYGPDLLLVDTRTGRVVEVVRGAIYY